MDDWINTRQSQPPLGVAYEPQPATFWQRAGALIIDLVALGFANQGLSRLADLLDGTPVLSWLALGLGWVVPFLYFAWPYSHSGQTQGKKLLGIRVVSLNGSELNWRHGILRTLGYTVSDLSFGLGYLWSLVDGDKQAWHDKLAGTCVIQGTRTIRAIVNTEEAASRQRRWWLGVGAVTILVVGCLAAAAIWAWPLLAQATEHIADPASDQLLEALGRRLGSDDQITAAGSSFEAVSTAIGEDEVWFVVEVTYAGNCTSSSSDPCEALANELAGIVFDNYDRIDELTGVEVVVSREWSAMGIINVTTTDVDERLTIEEWRRELSADKDASG